MLVGLFALTITGWCYRDTYKSDTSLKIGENSVIEVADTKSSALSFNFDGAVLGGEEIKQNISIKNTGEKDVFLRAKIVIFSSNHSEPMIYFHTNQSWLLLDDGYYYFNDILPSLGTIGLASSLIFSNEKQLASKDDYILTIIVESLSTEFDKGSVWGNE